MAKKYRDAVASGSVASATETALQGQWESAHNDDPATNAEVAEVASPSDADKSLHASGVKGHVRQRAGTVFGGRSCARARTLVTERATTGL